MNTREGCDRIESCEAKIAAAETEESRAFYRSDLKLSWPKAATYSPDWDKRDLIHLYEELDFEGAEEGILQDLEYSPEYTNFKKLRKEDTSICLSVFEHSSYNAKKVSETNEVITKKTLFWTTENFYKATKKFRSYGERQKDVRIFRQESHFTSCNWYFPLLLGSQHNNRFKRNTKVYILSGTHKGKHGTVVGHGKNFNVKRWGSSWEDNRSPLLKVLLICPSTGLLGVHDIRQDIVKLVDLHQKLFFALPALRPVDLEEEYVHFGKKRRKRIGV